MNIVWKQNQQPATSNQHLAPMTKRISFLILILLLPSLTLFSQDARISIFLHGEKTLNWSILDENYQTLTSADVYPGGDSLDFFLPYAQHYYLNLDLINSGKTDSLLVELLVDGSHILAILDTEEGDLMLPFYTGDSKNQLKIIGGTDAAIENFPWQVYFTAGRYLCGGSIIGEKWILTAAHCTFDDEDIAIPKNKMAIKVGTNYPKSSTTGKIYYIENVIVHEDYSPDTYLNDIAILELKDSIDFPNAHYIELINTDEVESGAADPGVLSWVTGWGLTAVDPDEHATILQKVQLPIVSNETASSVWGTVHESVLMAGYTSGNKDACSGDSGGPLIVPVGSNFRLAGIVSWGNSQCSTYGAYTRVSYFEDWIRAHSGVVRRYIPQIPFGDSLICDTELLTEYNPVFELGISEYEWDIIPSEAGIIQVNNGTAEVHWTENYTGIAELGIRGFFEGEFSEWKYKSILKVESTSIINQSSDTSLCESMPISLLVEAEGYDLKYLWSRNGEFYLSGTQNSVYFHSLILDNSAEFACEISGYCGVVNSSAIQLEVYPTTEVTAVSPDQHYENGESIFLEIIAEGHELSYSWKKNEITLAEENENQLIIDNSDATDIGLYSVLVSGSCGDEKRDSIYVFVSEDYDKSNSETEFLLWPSVVETELNIAINTDGIFSITVFDLNGNLILEKTENQYNTSIPKSNFSSGMYLIKIESENSKNTQKFIVQ